MIRRSLLTLLLVLAFFASPAFAKPKSGGSSTPKPVHVKPYTKKDGTHVEGHDRAAPTKKANAQSKTESKKTPANHATSTSTGTPVARDKNGKILRSQAAKHAFEVSSGYPHGRPGYVVDHVKPLACGGADDTSNMEWQTVAEGKAKDEWERRGCR
jgi:hypothetical protein